MYLLLSSSSLVRRSISYVFVFCGCVCCSEEEAKKKIYNVSCERYFGFGCEIDEETSNKLEGLFLAYVLVL